MPREAVQHAQHQLAETLRTYLPESEVALVLAACEFADIAHGGVIRKSGEPYILHPIAVTDILGHMRLDADSLMAALLHDVIEDTDYTKEQVSAQFGATVADLVDGVTKLTISKDKQINKAASFRKILMATLHDPRVIVIKLADRLHNMSTLEALSAEKRARIAQETIDIFVPMARLVGMNEIADQLEKLCFENLEPDMFARLSAALAESAEQRMELRLQRAFALDTLIEEIGLHGHITPRDNDILIFQRFFRGDGDLTTLLNTHAFEVVLDSVVGCDQLATALQQQFEWSELRDHIRNPLPGGNQALFLSVRDAAGQVDLTLQTSRMRDAARLGVVLGETAPQATRSAIQASLHNLSELIDRDCARSTLSALLDYLHRDKVLVYTPDGDLHELPQGATAVDFAYAASLFLGNHAIGAKIDGVIKPLGTPLKSGQVIEIITDVLANPNPDWLSFINTHKARRAIQNILREQDIEEQRTVGRQALNRALKLYKRNIQDLTEQDWQSLLSWQHLPNAEALFEQIAIGDLLPQLVASRLVNQTVAQNSDQLILGTQGIDLRYAHCCNPILGDPILGHLTRRGLIVHRRRCSNLAHEIAQHPEHILTLQWQEHTPEDPRFPVTLLIGEGLSDEQTTELIYRVRELKAGVEKLKIENQQTRLALLVRDRDHLARLIHEIRALLDFPPVTRLHAQG
ncbi:MAG: HD domain-containing protein [Pseudomonadota bacterium]|nr:HD domain-containing protein [Pseudomonadota bacterium]